LPTTSIKGKRQYEATREDKGHIAKARKAVAAAVTIVVVMLVAVGIAVISYLANCAIGHVGDGGDLNAEEVVIEVERTETCIEAERAEQAQETTEFLNAAPDEPIAVTAADGVHLTGLVYEHGVGDDTTMPASLQASSTPDASAPIDSQAFSDAIDSSTIDLVLPDQASPPIATASTNNR
jgi:hypothetical protein